MQGKGTTARFSFNAGEISQRLAARLDLERRGSSCKRLQNMVIITHGAATRRPGLQFVAEAKTS